jgi:hypothetical protein
VDLLPGRPRRSQRRGTHARTRVLAPLNAHDTAARGGRPSRWRHPPRVAPASRRPRRTAFDRMFLIVVIDHHATGPTGARAGPRPPRRAVEVAPRWTSGVRGARRVRSMAEDDPAAGS